MRRSPGCAPIADVNGDAKPDLATANVNSGNVTVLLNTSTAARSLSERLLAFGTQEAGRTSPAQTVTVTSNGDAALRVSRVRTTGADAADFLVVEDSCSGEAIAVGSSCLVRVRFAPQSEGAKTASVTLTDNTPGRDRVGRFDRHRHRFERRSTRTHRTSGARRTDRHGNRRGAWARRTAGPTGRPGRARSRRTGLQGEPSRTQGVATLPAASTGRWVALAGSWVVAGRGA